VSLGDFFVQKQADRNKRRMILPDHGKAFSAKRISLGVRIAPISATTCFSPLASSSLG
jgi:hypothetical protein